MTAGSFVGTATGSKLDVAVVATRPTAGQARKLSVYLCDDRTTRRWLTTTATGNTAALAAQGARVNVTLTASSATGTVTLPGRRALRFRVARATGPAGLYNVTITAAGQITGTSATGNRLAGRLGPATGVPNVRRVDATITTPTGRTHRLPAYAQNAAPGTLRLIVHPNGRARGGKNKGRDRNWTDPDPSPNR